MDSASSTAPARITTAELEAHLDWLSESPADIGRLELIVRRPGVNDRKVLAAGVLDLAEGLVGDNWSRRASTSGPHGGPDPDRQLTVMNSRIAGLVARSPERMALAGDQLFVDFDLSIDNAPAGTRLAIGTAVVELTEPPHLGCQKFVARFGQEAMRFVNSAVGRRMRLRGANAKVVKPGALTVGDTIRKSVSPEDRGRSGHPS